MTPEHFSEKPVALLVKGIISSLELGLDEIEAEKRLAIQRKANNGCPFPNRVVH